MLHQKIHYLHHNPVRIGVAELPEDWVYSSARDYAGGKGLIQLDALVYGGKPEVCRIRRSQAELRNEN